MGLGLWLLTLPVFFPLCGWSILGVGVGPQLIVGALVPYPLFAVVLWAMARRQFTGRTA